MRIFVFLLAALPFYLWGQTMDSISLVQFYKMVKQSHPIVNQAVLVKARGEAALSEARGAFDPKLMANYDRKQFENKNYYDLWETYVEIPTILNVDLKAGHERSSGIFLNPERTVPEDGLYYAGVSVPVGQGLFTNQRTINLKKGKLTRQELAIESDMILNNLFLDANHAYWNWYEQFEKLRLVQSNLVLIQERFDGIRRGVLTGENAAIDSVETLIQVQQWTNYYQKASVAYNNSWLSLENYLWDFSSDGIVFTPNGKQDELIQGLEHYINFAMTNHPHLRQLEVKGQKIDLDKRMNAEGLKPTANLQYNVLLAQNQSIEQTNFLSNNYKAGFNFNFPILIRKERARLKTSKLLRNETDLKIQQKRRMVRNKVEQNFNKVNQLIEMIRQQEAMINNYQLMLDGERTKFNNGESSIFLINTRENKKLDAEMKLIDLKSEYGQSIGRLKWSTGQLGLETTNDSL